MDASFSGRHSLFGTQPVVAQSQTAVETEILDSSVSAEDREKLLARLSDKEVRDIVWNLIQTNPNSQETDNPLAAELNQLTSNLRSNFDKRIQHIPKLLALPSLLVEAITPPGKKKDFSRSFSHDRIGHFIWMDRSIPLQKNDKSRL